MRAKGASALPPARESVEVVDDTYVGKVIAATLFDTLKNAGFTDVQSQASVFAIQASIKGKLATKTDLTGFATKTDIAKLRADIYRALWIQGIGIAIATAVLVGVIDTIIKLTL